jgi:hypothetical protein
MAASALGSQMMQDVAALWTSGNYTGFNTLGAATGANRGNSILIPRRELGKRYVYGDLLAVFNSDVAFGLWSDNSIVDVTFRGIGIGESKLPMIHNVTIAEYSDLPSNSENLIGVVGRKDSMVFASRTPSDAGFADLPAVGQISKVTEPKSGISVQLRQFYDMRLGRRQVTYAIIYGVAKGNGQCLHRLKT